MNRTYYIRLGESVRGPYSVEDLRELADSNRFGPMYEVSPDRKRWKPADEIPQLFPRQSHAKTARKRSGAPRATTVPAATASIEARRPHRDQTTESTSPADAAGTQSTPAQAGPFWRYAIDGIPAEKLVSLDTLRALVATRKVSDQTLVWRDGMPDWAPAYLVPELDSAMLAAESHPETTPLGSAASSTAAAALGGVAYAALLVCTVMLVTRMRESSFMASENVPVFFLMVIDLLLGMAAVVLGHMAVADFRNGNQRHRRGRIVVGLSAGYTVLIILVLLSIAVVAAGNDSDSDETTARRAASMEIATVFASSGLPALTMIA